MILIYLGIYVIAIVGLAFYFSLKNTESDFIIAGRNRPMWQIILSKLAGVMGTGFFLIYTAYTYQYGWSSLLLVVFFALSYTVFAFWAIPKIYRRSREKQFVTIGDFVSDQLSSLAAGRLIDRVTVVVSFIWILSSFIGGVKIISAYLEISYGGAVVVTLILVSGYMLLSGYRAVLITDVAQAFIICGLLALGIHGLFTHANWQSVSSTMTESFPLTLLIGIVVFGFFSTFSAADRYQLVYSARSEKTAVYGALLGIIPFTLVFIPIILIGLFMRSQMPALDPDVVFMSFIQNFSSSTYYTLAAVMLVAGLMSTLDTWIYAIATHFKKFTTSIQSNTVSDIRKNILIISLLLAFFAFFFRDLLSIAILGVILVVTSSVAMLYIFSGGKFAERFMASVTCGILAAVIGVTILGSVPEALSFSIVGGALGLLIPIRWLKKVRFL